jgi:hypothetical protein
MSRMASALVLAMSLLTLGGVAPGRADQASLLASPFFQQGEKLTSTELTEHAEQGFSVAISADGSTALVGGRAYNNFAGASWIYTRSGATWTQQAKLIGKGASALAEQGFSVALSADGDTALIGAPEDEEKGVFPGAAWVFTRSGTSWSEQQKLVGAGGSTPAGQGRGVALSADGNTALIGGDEDNGGVGATWVFTRSGTTWAEQQKLVGTHKGSLVQEGSSVALSGDGNTALIGGPRAEGAKGEKEVGAAWVFTRSGSIWQEQEQLPVVKGVTEETGLGQSVALSANGNTALVGGPGYDKALGAAWVFTLEGGKWTQQGEKLLGEDASTEPQQGHSVSLSEDGSTALVGAYHDDTSVGAAWAFVRSGSTWSEQEKLVGTGSVGGFPTQGTGVALSGSGDTALVGGAGDNGEVGATWVFARSEWKTCGQCGGGIPVEAKSSGGGTSDASGGASASSNATSGVATTPAAVEQLLLGCSKRSLVLNDVLIRGERVYLQGSAAQSLRGKQVRIVFDSAKQVATATVGASGEFETTAPLPPPRLRESNSARYTAESGGQRSLALKLVRRLSLEPPKASGTTVTLVGQVVAPLTKPIAAVAIEQQLECGRSAVVKRFTPSASGRFRVSVTVPSDAKAGIYRLISSVRKTARSSRGFATYSLPLPVLIG